MDINECLWLEDLQSLNDAKNMGFITEEEYEHYKEIRKEQIYNGKWEKKLPEMNKEEEQEMSMFDFLDVEEFIDNLIDIGDDNLINEQIKNMSRVDLHRVLDVYNWDNGFQVPRAILENENCDMALAMEVFDLADGCSFLEEYYLKDKVDKCYDEEWADFCIKMLENIGSGKHPIVDFYEELPYGLKIALRKKGMNNILTQD